MPVVREYLTDLSAQLAGRGYDDNVLAMHSGGGVMTTDVIAYYAARIANSGATAGAIVGQYVAEQCGFENVIGFDMGARVRMSHPPTTRISRRSIPTAASTISTTKPR